MPPPITPLGLKKLFKNAKINFKKDLWNLKNKIRLIIDLHQFWRDLDTRPLLGLFLHAVLGEDKRGRERNSNDAIGQKSEHSKLVKDYKLEV